MGGYAEIGNRRSHKCRCAAGNGRWSRLCCDAVVSHLAKEPPIIWATDTLVRDSTERKAYIAALKLADEFNYQALTAYLVERNGDR